MKATQVAQAVLLTLLLGFVFVRYLGAPIDYDLWYHLRVGQEIQSTGQIPHYDTFIGIADRIPAFYRVNDEWGLGWLAWQVYQVGGCAGLALALSLTITCLLAVVYAGCRAGGMGAVPALALTLLADQVMATRYAFRPHLFTQLFAALVILFYLRAERSHHPRRWLWAMVPVFVLWTNVHAGVSLGVGLLGLWLGMSVLGRSLGPPPPLGWRVLLGPGAACLLAILIRPDDYLLPTYVFTHFHRPLAYAWVMEWQPLGAVLPDWWRGPIALFLVLAAAAFGLAARYATLRPTYFLATGSLTYFAFKWVRALGELGAVGTPLVASTWAETWPRLKLPERLRRLVGGPLPGVLLGLVLAILLAGEATRPEHYRFDPSPDIYPVGAVAFLEQHPVSGAIFCSNQFGGYLIFRHLKPYFHSVMSAIPDAVVQDYFKLRDHPQELAAMVERYNLGAFLLHYEYFDNQRLLIRALAQSPEWSLVYFDNLCVLYLPGRLGLPAYRAVNPALEDPLGADRARARRELEQYLAQNPRVARGWLLWALLGQRLADPRMQAEGYRHALELTPDDPTARLGRARLRFEAKDYAGALQDAREAVRLAPNWAPARYSLAVALLASGDSARARSELNRCLALEPNFRPALELLDKL